MPTKVDFRGVQHETSQECYVLVKDTQVGGYHKGVVVILIAMQEGQAPGWHRSSGYVTICRADADQAEFVGVPERMIQPMEPANSLPVWARFLMQLLRLD